MSHRGISTLGAYIPRRRLSRKAIVAAHRWANPNLSANGMRAICGHDEDSITMAVAAARHALEENRNGIDKLLFASTSMPFADRQNATLIAEALSLPAELRTADCGGSLRAGTGALLSALESNGSALVIAAEQRRTRPGSSQELSVGDAAVALVVDSENLLARFVGSQSLSVDFTDHYRASDAAFDYSLEERWIREEGLLKLVPRTIAALLERCGVPAQRIDHLIVAGCNARNARTLATHCGIAANAVADDLFDRCGDTGSAHALLLLADVLQRAEPGASILVAGFGQGCDALLFEATADIDKARAQSGVPAALAAGVEDDNYLRYLSFNHLIEMDWGMRAERDNRTAQAAFYRHRKTATAFVGSRCGTCGTAQFPQTRICVNPECRATDTQLDEPFKDLRATVKSFTEDWLALSYNPPLLYGNVRFQNGAVTMLEFTDFAPGELRVGTPLGMQFRIKDNDDKRGFRRYCWKAAPAGGN